MDGEPRHRAADDVELIGFLPEKGARENRGVSGAATLNSERARPQCEPMGNSWAIKRMPRTVS